MSRSVRRIRPINLTKECLAAATVLVVLVPILTGFGVIFASGLVSVLGGSQEPAISITQWAWVWLLVTFLTLVIGVTVTTFRLREGRSQPHRSEYGDFKLIRHARHGPLLKPQRRQVGDFEVVSFGLRYILSPRRVRHWWPVFNPQKEPELKTYCHSVFLCPLPAALPSFQLWSRSHRWDASFAGKIIRLQGLGPKALAEHFDFAGAERGAALLSAEDIIQLLQAHSDWSLEVINDRLLAYKLPAPEVGTAIGATKRAAADGDVEYVAQLARQISAHAAR